MLTKLGLTFSLNASFVVLVENCINQGVGVNKNCLPKFATDKRPFLTILQKTTKKSFTKLQKLRFRWSLLGGFFFGEIKFVFSEFSFKLENNS